MLKKATFMNRNEKQKNIITSLASRTPRFLTPRLTRRSSGRGPRPLQDRAPRAAPPFQPRPLNASVRCLMRICTLILISLVMLMVTPMFDFRCQMPVASDGSISILEKPIRGIVRDGKGKPIANCLIEVQDLGGSTIYKTVSNDKGEYVIERIPSKGLIRIIINPKGCAKVVKKYSDQDELFRYPPGDLLVCSSI